MGFRGRVVVAAAVVGFFTLTPQGQDAWATAWNHGQGKPPTHHAARSLPSSGATGVLAARHALAQLGKPYVWGANGGGAFDCSGLVIFGAWRPAGANWPDSTANVLGHHFPSIHLTQARPGDLLLWDWGHDGRFDHVAIVVSGRRYVEAPKPGSVVQVHPLRRAPPPTRVVRPDRTW